MRGASGAQLATIALVEASLIALPAVALAPWVATGVLHALNAIGPLATIGMHLEPQVSSAAYALAAGAGVVCVVGLVLPTLRAAPGRGRGRPSATARRPRPARTPRSRDRGAGAARATGSAPLPRRPHPIGAGSESIPFSSLRRLFFWWRSAALAQVGAVRGQARRAHLGFHPRRRRRPRLLAARPAPSGYTRSVLLLVLAVAIGVFAAAYSTTWHQSQVDQADYAAGADLLVEPGQVGGVAVESRSPRPIGRSESRRRFRLP